MNKYTIIKYACIALTTTVMLSGCLTTGPAVDTENPIIRLQVQNAATRPTFVAPNPTVRDMRCVFLAEDSAQLQLVVTDGGGMRVATLLALGGNIEGSVGAGITITPTDGNVRGILDNFGGDDSLQLQFAERDGRSLNAASAVLTVTDLPAFIHVEATDRQGNTQQFADTIELRRIGTAAGGSCIGG